VYFEAYTSSMRLRLTLKVGRDEVVVHRPGRVATTIRQSSCSCGSSVRVDGLQVLRESEASIAPRAAVVRPLAASAIEHHDAQRLAEVGAGDHAGLDRGVHHQPVLDRGRRDVLALAGLEQVLHAAGDRRLPSASSCALVAGVQPAVLGERSRVSSGSL
jgi:hypothetical protein